MIYEGSAIDCLAKGLIYTFGTIFGLLALVIIIACFRGLWILIKQGIRRMLGPNKVKQSIPNKELCFKNLEELEKMKQYWPWTDIRPPKPIEE